MPTVTAFLTFAVLGGLLAYDLWVYRTYGTEATITGLVRWANERWPLVAAVTAFLFGVLWGHWFF